MAAAVLGSYGEDISLTRLGIPAIREAVDQLQEPAPNSSVESVTRNYQNESEERVMSSSSYILASDVSDPSGDVDRWLNGSNSSTPRATGLQCSRPRVTQRSTVTSACALNHSLWYLAALILPLFSVHNCVMTLRCTHSTMVNAAQVLCQHVSRLCSRVKAHIQRIAQDRFASEVFAATMDVILVVYALGFLFLSMYQTTIIG